MNKNENVNDVIIGSVNDVNELEAKYVFDFAISENIGSTVLSNGLNPMQYIKGILTFAEKNIDDFDIKDDVGEKENTISELINEQNDLRRSILGGDYRKAPEKIKAIREKFQELISDEKNKSQIAEDCERIISKQNEIIKDYDGYLNSLSEVYIGLYNNSEILSNARLAGISESSRLIKSTDNLEKELLEKVIGQDFAVKTFARGIFNAQIISDENRHSPPAIFVFAGPPGVGKTFLAKQAAPALGRGKPECFDMSGFTGKQQFVGMLTASVKNNPRRVLIFDEIEKADIEIINLFLQILDAGQLLDSCTEENVDFKETIIIMTTNAGRQLYEDKRDINISSYHRNTILNALETDKREDDRPFFPAAICSRIATGYPIMFNHLCALDLINIITDEMKLFAGLFREKHEASVLFDNFISQILLLENGGHADARTLRAQAEMFFKNKIRDVIKLLKNNNKDTGEIDQIEVKAILRNENSNEILDLFSPRDKTNIIFFGRKSDAAVLEFEYDGYERDNNVFVHFTFDFDYAKELISGKDILYVIIQLDWFNPVCKDGLADDSRQLLNYLLREWSDIPVYLNHADDNFEYNQYIQNSYMYISKLERYIEDGVEGIVEIYTKYTNTKPGTTHIEYDVDGNEIIKNGDGSIIGRNSCSTNVKDGIDEKEILKITRRLYMQEIADRFAARRNVLSYKTIQKLEGYNISVELSDFNISKAIDADDMSMIADGFEIPNICFDDVLGAKTAKESLQYYIKLCKNPKKLLRAGGMHSILLYGEPGTGKTLLAQAFAKESGLTFIAKIGSDFKGKYVGDGPRAVRALFSTARKYAPCAIFIDEIDNIGGQRTGSEFTRVDNEILTAILDEMEGFRTNTKAPVFFIAATNYGTKPGEREEGTLDKALVDRFTEKIIFNKPDKQDLYEYLKREIGKHSNSVSDSELKSLANQLVLGSFRELSRILERTVRKAGVENKVISYDLLREEIATNSYGEKRNLGEEYVSKIAYHEAGHALISIINGKIPELITIVSRGNFGGYVQHDGANIKPSSTKHELLSEIRVLLGGRAAEMVIYGDDAGTDTGASSDLAGATNIAKSMLLRYGMYDDFGLVVDDCHGISNETRVKINEILKEQMAKTIEIIKSRKNDLEMLANALINSERNELRGEEIKEMFAGIVFIGS